MNSAVEKVENIGQLRGMFNVSLENLQCQGQCQDTHIKGHIEYSSFNIN